MLKNLEITNLFIYRNENCEIRDQLKVRAKEAKQEAEIGKNLATFLF